MGQAPPPPARIPKGATLEQRIQMYRDHAEFLIAGLWPWQRKSARAKMERAIADARKKAEGA